MNIEQLEIADVSIDVVRKPIKNMHLAVYPPTGRVRLAVPEGTSETVLRNFAISKLTWIRKQVRNMKSQKREPYREFVSGESHYLFGRRYMLLVEEGYQNQIRLKGNKIILRTPKPLDRQYKANYFNTFYRRELRKLIPEYIAKWEQKLGVKANDWVIRSMKTKWGSCNPETKRILLNLELAKKPLKSIEYVVLHELCHLVERTHNERFVELLDHNMLDWVARRMTLL